jgi:hypothetical protein
MKESKQIEKLTEIIDLATELKENLEGGGEGSAESADADADGADKEDSTEAVEVNLPASADDIKALGKDEVLAFCEKLGIDADGKKQSELKALLVTVLAIQTDDMDDVEQEEVDALAEAVGVTAAKKMSATVEALKEYFGPGEAKEADEAAPKNKSKDEDAAEDSDVDPAAIAKKSKVPKTAIMLKRLNAFNEAAGKKAIEIEDEDDEEAVEKAYRKLLVRLVDHEGNIAEWGTPYIKDDEHYCAGLPLEEAKVKGHKMAGLCQVTGTTFTISDENEYTEVED